MESPLVSVIVLFDRGGFEPCLSSLLCQTGVGFEIIAVIGADEGDEVEGSLTLDGSSGEVARDPRLHPLSVKDRNPALRRNLAACEARGRYLAFIDDDAFAPPEWLDRGISFLEAHPVYAGIGGPNLRPEDSTGLELLTDLVLTTPLLGAGSRAYRGGGSRAPAKPGEIHLVNFMVRKDAFDSVGGFNEALGYGGEDTEFLYLASKQGESFLFDPDLFVFHKRRPFGMPYLTQRFRLRRQSGRLFAARPGIYSRSMSFWAALAGPPMVLALVVLFMAQGSWCLLGLLVLLYVVSCMALSALSKRPKALHVLFSPAALFVHHLVNVCGLWLGLVEAWARGRAGIKPRRKV
ncbi:MAG: glycosyltransferase family 2 protein [bacterium]